MRQARAIIVAGLTGNVTEVATGIFGPLAIWDPALLATLRSALLEPDGDSAGSTTRGPAHPIRRRFGRPGVGAVPEDELDPGTAPPGMVLIPAGCFIMGCTSGDRDSDAPPVSVDVSAFYMARHEVTKALWDEVRTWGLNHGYTDLAAGCGRAPDHPVHTISWFDMVKWCNARSSKDGLTPVYTVNGATMTGGTAAPHADWAADGYRLPTEAEWEKAARGGVGGKRFPWGTDTITHGQANYFSTGAYGYDVSPTRGFHPAYADDHATAYTSPVGSFAANGYGLHDMVGNVYEWCWDWYAASSYREGVTDPRGAASGSDRVCRGGGWDYHADHGRAASRLNCIPSSASRNLGFRVARSSVR